MADHTVLPTLYPKLRPLDIRPHAHNGQPYLMLRDPLHLSDRLLLLPQAMGAVLAFCDGAHSPAEMTRALSHYAGVAVPANLVTQVIVALDEALLLENDRAAAALAEARAHFRQAPCRPPLLAGQSYPAAADELHALLEGYLAQARLSRNGTEPRALAGRVGLLSPHIDYPRGGVVYAEIWEQAAAAVQAADLVVIFGTDHYGVAPFTLTRQHYATPYGILPTAGEIVDRLAAVVNEVEGEDAAFAGELRHRGEHSLELVAVWLHHMRRRQPVEVVPILVGGFHHFIHNGASPAQDELLQRVLATLAGAVHDRNVVVVASGDLAHVGPAFGGEPLDVTRRAAVADADARLIEQMAAGSADGFFEGIRQIRDANNVCGVAPIYLTLQLLQQLGGAVTGEAAGYASCPADDRNSSAVTVGGMLFQTAGV
jgi:AmmeMemoRadiSam system protein B